jgi:hypothetical protein
MTAEPDPATRWFSFPALFVVLGGAVGGLAYVLFGMGEMYFAGFPPEAKDWWIFLMFATFALPVGIFAGLPAALFTGLAAAGLRKLAVRTPAYVPLCGALGSGLAWLQGTVMTGQMTPSLAPGMAFAGGVAGVLCGWLTRERGAGTPSEFGVGEPAGN